MPSIQYQFPDGKSGLSDAVSPLLDPAIRFTPNMPKPSPIPPKDAIDVIR